MPYAINHESVSHLIQQGGSKEVTSMAGLESDTPGLARSELVRVLESAARLQEIVPDAILVGGSAAAL